jgi:FixJ family two-component response regulator
MEVLLVDDEQTVCDAVSGFLRRCGFVVRMAADGAEALRSLSNDPPGVVITDVRMPGMSGLDLLECIRVRSPGTPVIIITGYADLDSTIDAIHLGAYDFMPKPVRMGRLVEILRRIERCQLLEGQVVRQTLDARDKEAMRDGYVDRLAVEMRDRCHTLRGLWHAAEPALRAAPEIDADLTDPLLNEVGPFLEAVEDTVEKLYRLSAVSESAGVD